MAEPFTLGGEMKVTLVASRSKRSFSAVFIAKWPLYRRHDWGFQAVSLEVPRLGDLGFLTLVDGCVGAEIFATAYSDSRFELGTQISAPLSHPWFKWWLESTCRAERQDPNQNAILVLVLPIQSGYLARTDVIQTCLAGWANALFTFSRDEPEKLADYILAAGKMFTVSEIFDTAIGAALVEVREAPFDEGRVLDELRLRLALPLVINREIPQRRIALVSGGFNLELRKRLFMAASGLRILLVVLDEPDKGLADRIVAAIKSFPLPIDGITTVADRFLCSTARAAEMLSLPTQPAEAFETTVNKELMRKLIPLPAAKDTACGKTSADSVGRSGVIVKPSEGGRSFGIFLAMTNQQRREAEAALKALGKKAVFEAYIDGPEVDINIILHKGNALVAEISDNLPTTAEGYPSQFVTHSWVETGSIFPSGLSDGELDLLHNTTTSYLLQLGFQTGVFHCEARIIRSTSTYRSKLSGYPRLVAADESRHCRTPEVAIIEINARAPGSKASEESNYSSGIDYYAVQLLAACGDDVQFAALAHPFAGQLGWWGSGSVPAEKGGTFKPLIMFKELTIASPVLMKRVVRWTVFFEDGEHVQDDGKSPVASVVPRSFNH